VGSNPTSSATKLKATLKLQRLRFRSKRAIARLFYPVLSQRCPEPLDSRGSCSVIRVAPTPNFREPDLWLVGRMILYGLSRLWSIACELIPEHMKRFDRRVHYFTEQVKTFGTPKEQR